MEKTVLLWICLVCVLGSIQALVVDPEVIGYMDIEFVKGEGWLYKGVRRFGDIERRTEVGREQIEGTSERVGKLNGEPVEDIQQFPYMGSLQIAEVDGVLIFVCSLHFISSSIAITAAHCIQPATTYAACGGSVDARQPGTCSRVEEVILHPDFQFFDFLSPDVAVLLLEEDIFQENVSSIRLKFEFRKRYETRPVIVTGFSTSGTRLPLLTAIKTQLRPREECNLIQSLETRDPSITSKRYLLCTSGEFPGQENGYNVCTDAGAPLTVKGPVQDFSLGVSSLGACEEFPGDESIFISYSNLTIANFLQPFYRKVQERRLPRLICPPTDSGATWYRSKGYGRVEVGFTALKTLDMVDETEHGISDGHLSNKTFVFVERVPFGGAWTSLLHFRHGAPQDVDGRLVDSVSASVRVDGLPADTYILSSRGTTKKIVGIDEKGESDRVIMKLDKSQPVRFDSRWGGQTRTGFTLILPVPGIVDCIDLTVLEIERPTKICLLTSDSSFKTGRCYKNERNFVFNVCPWSCDAKPR